MDAKPWFCHGDPLALVFSMAIVAHVWSDRCSLLSEARF